MMKKILGLALAIGLLSQSANAALLATWNFNTNASGTVSAGVNGSATDFVNVGANGAEGINGSRSASGGVSNTGSWSTGTITNDFNSLSYSRYNSLSFTNTDSAPLLLEELSFQLRKANGGVGPNTASVYITYILDGGTESEGGLGTGLTAFQNVQAPLSLLLGAGKTIEFRFYYYRSGTTTGAVLDDFKLSGGTVPEPTSIAVFTLLGGGLVARRFRRRA